ncbi:hypothetical protein DXF96_12140 [Heyndrickxia coagulans]|nr:hypothetical protein CYJ15_06625 [Heyndrickxia coagulans]QDI62171.1 hypothetical protein DXF96_12140 [Heyndrickxia coagulans]
MTRISATFDSLMTRFRKRLNAKIINELNEWIVPEEQKRQLEEASKGKGNDEIIMMFKNASLGI